MKLRFVFVIGYIFLILGLLLGARMAFYLIRELSAPPTGSFIAALGAGFAWLFYVSASISIIMGAILLRKHKSILKKIFGIFVILLGIVPQILVFFITSPVGPTSENLVFFLLPFVLYLISGILLFL
jgi:hypothetical protein